MKYELKMPLEMEVAPRYKLLTLLALLTLFTLLREGWL